MKSDLRERVAVPADWLRRPAYQWKLLRLKWRLRQIERVERQQDYDPCPCGWSATYCHACGWSKTLPDESERPDA